MRVRRTGAIALAAAALAVLILAGMVMSGAVFDWRVGPVRVRAASFLRPLAWSGVLGVLAAWAAWPWKSARRAAIVFAAGWVLVAASGYASRADAAFVPVSDIAVIESYTIHATDGRLFVGPYSRYQWHHPGPLFFYALAPFYVLSGHRSAGLSAGALAINLISLLAILMVAARAGRATLVLAAGGATVAFMWRASEIVVSQWNPHALVLPTMALMLLCAETVAARPRLLPLVAVVASLVVQTHVGLVPTIFAVAGATIGAMAASAYAGGAGDRRQHLRSAVNLTAWALAFAWLLPLVEQLYKSPGNLSELWRFFALEDRTGQTLRVSVRAWADMLSALVRPDFHVAWGGEFEESDAAWSGLCAVAQLALLAALFGRAAWTRQRFQASLAGLLLMASLVALWSVTRIEDDIYDHAVFWIAGIGVLNIAVLADAATALVLPARARAFVGRLTGVIAVALFAAGTAIGGQALDGVVRASFEPNLEQLSARRLAEAVEEELRTGPPCKPLVRIDQPTWPIAAGVLLQLQRDDIPYAVEEGWLPMFSDAVSARGDETCVLSIVWPEERARLEGAPEHEEIVERDRVSIFLSRTPPR